MPNGMPSIIPDITLHLPEGKKVYWASDQHLGAPTQAQSRVREQQFLQWLQHIQHDVGALFLVGDLFDFWFEYKKVVPKGYVRILGKLAEMTDRGIPVYFFVGNHDLWMQGYFEEELSIPVFREPQHIQIGQQHMLVGHGDGKGPGDKGYKRMKKVFTHPLSKWLYRWLHPDIGVALAQHLSVNNKLISGAADIQYKGEASEWLIAYCQRRLEQFPFDYLIFGHRHLPLFYPLTAQSTYVNLGDWVNYFTYAQYDGQQLKLLQFPSAAEYPSHHLS